MNEFQNLFDEDTLRKNIEFAALFVLNYECLKEYVVSQVREFYSDSISFVQGEMIFKESENYKKNVRSLANKIDTASIMWFVNAGAITEQEVHLYQKIDNWWINEIEIPTSAEKIPADYNRDQVFGGQAFVLSAINDIILANGADKYNEILELLRKMQKEKNYGQKCN